MSGVQEIDKIKEHEDMELKIETSGAYTLSNK